MQHRDAPTAVRDEINKDMECFAKTNIEQIDLSVYVSHYYYFTALKVNYNIDNM